ncbi:MAG: discoidin domain-containing protein, partial [Planctomycetes bacterium]|nr:discoidin domain-containing protein [Planctomycetota bacterium]
MTVSARFSIAPRGAAALTAGLLVCAARGTSGSCGEPANIAPRARITASSSYSAAYEPRFAVDGQVPAELGRSDEGRAWCVRGDEARGRGWLRLEWKEPVAVGEVVYFGRTAWMLSECWKDYEVWLDDDPAPAAQGAFAMRHGPQRVPIRPASEARSLTLRFLSSHGGLNPGASEVLVFSESPSEEALARCLNPRWSPELAARLRSGALGFDRVLLVQRHPVDPSHVYTYHNEGFRPGGGLCVLSLEPGGRLQRLAGSPEGQILDCDLSHDAREVLFSMRADAEATYQVYRIGVDGSGLRQLTEDDSHNFNACWLPDGAVAFLSTRKPAFAYCWTSPVGILHTMDHDGRDVRRLSANYLNDFTPAVLDDGRIIYGRWEYVDRPAIPIQSLWTLRPDGTGLGAFFGNRVLSPATFIEPRSVPGTAKVLCTLTAHNGPCRGAVGLLDPTLGLNAQEAIANLTPEVDIGRVEKGDGNHVRGPYENPFPLDRELFLVSRAGTVIVRDYEGTREAELIAPRDGMGFYSPQPVRPRGPPAALAATLPAPPDAEARGPEAEAAAAEAPAAEAEPGWATVFLLDVYDGLEPHVRRGEVKRIGVVQELE